jgi:lipopolysaccharide/colanic/teichoic acid biosynthesis glycosyltransferase
MISDNSVAVERVAYILHGSFLKRPFDFCLAFFGILLSSPLWFVISAIIWIEDWGPIFYIQDRIGKKGRRFRAYKFRSMVMDAEKDDVPVQAVENDPRVTRIGRILRKTAMDELPQLINILIGDMSFVGPRALRPQEKEINGNGMVVRLHDYPGYNRRHETRPGLTGLAQIYLPADAPRKAKFRYDLLYLEQRSFWLDIKLILLSFWITFRAKWESGQNKI